MMAFRNRPFYLKHKLLNNIVEESYIEFVVTEEMAEANYGMTAGTYYLRGGISEVTNEEKTVYENNKEILLNAFGTSNCIEYSNDIGCSVNGLNAAVSTFGNIAVYVNDNVICLVNGGASYCYDE